MKKIIKSLLTVSTIMLSLSFMGCYDTIYDDIMHAVEPETVTVSGVISSVARYNIGDVEFLVTTGTNPNNSKEEKGLRYKLADENKHGQWKTLPENKLPFNYHKYDYYETQEHTGQQLLKVLADEENLYLVTCEYYNNKDKGTSCPTNPHIWQTKMSLNKDSEFVPGDWTDVVAGTDYLKFYTYGDYTFSAFSVFGTNSPNPAHRFVYIRSGNAKAHVEDYTATSVYQLSGSGAPVAISVSPVDTKEGTADNVQSALYYPFGTADSNGVIFFNTMASATNENKDTAPTRFYYASGNNTDTVWYSDYESTNTNDSNLEEGKGVGDPIASIAVNSNSILVGKGDFYSTTSSTTGGIERVELNAEGVPATTLGEFSTNAQNQFSSSYIVSTLLSMDPLKSELDNTLYASIEFIGTGTTANVSYNKIGLWSYYPDRGNWNRE